MTVVNAIFRIRRDTAANWTAANPVLRIGEPGLETDTRKWKFGDGVTAWNALLYAGAEAAWGAISGTLADQADLAAALAAKADDAATTAALADKADDAATTAALAAKADAAATTAALAGKAALAGATFTGDVTFAAWLIANSITWFNDQVRFRSGKEARFYESGNTNFGTIHSSVGGQLDLTNGGGIKASWTNANVFDVAGQVRCDTFRLDQAPAAGSIVPTHTITISCNGVNYKIPVIAA